MPIISATKIFIATAEVFDINSSQNNYLQTRCNFMNCKDIENGDKLKGHLQYLQFTML